MRERERERERERKEEERERESERERERAREREGGANIIGQIYIALYGSEIWGPLKTQDFSK